MFKDLACLSHVRWLILKNHFTRPNAEKVLRWSLILGLGSLFLVGDYVFFYRIIHYLNELPLDIGEELIVQLVNVVNLALFAMVIFSSFIASLSIFYMSSDLELLFSLPLNLKAVVGNRIMQTVVNASWVVVVFALPIFVAYGYYFSVPWHFYLYLLACFLPFIVLPSILGAMGIMILMRYFPTNKAHQILSFVGLFFLIGIVMFFRFLSPEKFFNKDVSDEMIIGFVESLRVPEYGFLPSSWMTSGLTTWVAGDIPQALMQLGFLAGGAILLLVLFQFFSGKVYLSSWRSYQEVRNAPRDQTREGSGYFWLQWVPMSPPQRALLIKDLRMFFRDPAHWSQLFILVALVIVYIFNIMNLPLENLVLKNVVSVLNIGLVGFVLASLVVRFVFSSTSIEGKKIWTICTAPVNMRNFLVGKFWMYFPPLLLVGEFLVVVSNYLLQVDAFVMKVSIIGVFLITTGLVGMGVGMGAMYPQFDHENISEISTGTGGILFMISSLLFVGLVVILGARPMYVHLNEKFLLQSVGGIDVPILYGAIVFLSVFVTLEPLRRGIRVLKTRDY